MKNSEMKISKYAVLIAALLGFIYALWLGDIDSALFMLALVCVGVVLIVYESQMKDNT